MQRSGTLDIHVYTYALRVSVSAFCADNKIKRIAIMVESVQNCRHIIKQVIQNIFFTNYYSKKIAQFKKTNKKLK